MKTSSPYRLAFFKKEGCPPCAQAQANLEEATEVHQEYLQHVAVLHKEYHPALVASFNLQKYPTVLILDEQGKEVSRKVGAAYLTADWWQAALNQIHKNHE